jgi:hypothetical protein
MSESQTQADEPQAWGVYGFVDGKWQLQFPVRESEERAKEDYAMYAPGTALVTRALYVAPMTGALRTSHAALAKALEATVDAMGRASHNLGLAIADKPVRDLAETYAEVAHAEMLARAALAEAQKVQQ